jgi:hypothetical protein
MNKKDLVELIKEHVKLLKVLRSPSHKDDLKEAAEQAQELEGYKKELKKNGL